MTKALDSRELALDILIEILEKGSFSHVVLNQALGKYQYLDKQDRAFITRLVEGTLEYQIQIDYVLEQFSSTKLSRMKPLIRTLLRMSVYQILHMDRIPDSAVCNEAVKLSEKRRFAGLKGFVNGVLRNISRQKEQIRFPDDSIRYSMPRWIVELWLERYDENTVEAILKAFLEERPLTVRCSCDRQMVMDSLERQGVSAKAVDYFGESMNMLSLEGIDYLEKLEAFQKGWIIVQDVSSALAAQAAGIKAGDRILDVCGAPGGKALHAAQLLKEAERTARGPAPEHEPAAKAAGWQNAEDKESSGSGHVLVRDISERKVSLIQDNIARSGCTNITAQVWDAEILDESMVEQADVVLSDLPCSGLGVIGRKPDIKYRIHPEDLKTLAELQRRILSVVCRYVKPGGTLVYSTCTIDAAENEENLRWFLANHPFEPVNLKGRLGGHLDCQSLEQGYVQLLPGIHPCDGFFLSVMRRK